MKTVIDKANTRGYFNHGWLKTYHTFSFADYYNPRRIHFGALRVLNDDTVAPGEGFGMHPHKNMEVVSIPLQGYLRHGDSVQNESTIAPGEIQVMSTGTGIYHSEYNASKTEDAKFLQIWIIPNEQDAKPNYQQIRLDPHEQPNHWHLICGPNGNAPMHIRQNAEVKTAVIQQGQSLQVQATQQINYIHVVSGTVQIAEHRVEAGGAIAFLDDSEIQAIDDAQVIWFDLPEVPH